MLQKNKKQNNNDNILKTKKKHNRSKKNIKNKGKNILFIGEGHFTPLDETLITNFCRNLIRLNYKSINFSDFTYECIYSFSTGISSSFGAKYTTSNISYGNNSKYVPLIIIHNILFF